MPALVNWLRRRFRPPGGWTLLLFLLIAILSPVAALAQTEWDLDLATLVLLTFLAVPLALGLARSRSTSRRAGAVGFVGGLIAVAALQGRVLPPLSLMWSEIPHAIVWYRSLQAGQLQWPLPGLHTLSELGRRAREIGLRLWWWSQNLATGEAAQDPIILNWTVALLIWAIAFFAAWHIYRHRTALIGLLPSGVLTATLTFFGAQLAAFYLVLYLLCTLSLVAIGHLWTETGHWDRMGTDYPGDLGLELALTLAPWLLMIVLLAAFFPVIRPRQIGDAFWRIADEPWSRLTAFSERVVGPLGDQFPGRARPGSGDLLPNAHLLGAAPELTEAPVFYVKTNDPPPVDSNPDDPAVAGPRRYWRGATYDLYSGRGWESSPLERRPLPPGGRLSSAAARVEVKDQADTDDLVQSFSLLPSQTNTLYAANAPLQVDQPAETWWRTEDDLAQLTTNTRQYTVLSRAPQPTQADLRAAAARLPTALRERYSALPDTLPQRVRDLTAEIVAGATTDWEQAHRLESFLRAYPYNLDLPAPPENRDLVDYFLFELQEGYCDYYASAMVVMARVAGLPARFATGYAQGTYLPDTQQWAVIGKDAHSWAEIYFEGIGWVEFEPTAGQSSLVRPGGEGLTTAPIPPLPNRSVRQPLLLCVGLPLAGLLFLATFIALIWFRPRGHSFSSRDLIRDRYARLTRWGVRLGAPLSDGQTPQEFGLAFGSTLQARGRRTRWVRLQHAAEKVPPEVQTLTEAYTRVQYNPEPIPERQGWQIRDLWLRLRRHLWLLWFGRH